MSIPPNWWQIWFALPTASFIREPFFMLNFNTPFTTLPSGFSLPVLINDLWAWYDAGVGKNIYWPFLASRRAFGYTAWYPPLTGVDLNSAASTYPVANDVLPPWTNVLCRRFSNIIQPGGQPILRLNGVRWQDQEDGILKPAAFAAWSAAADALVPDWFSQGVRFSNVIPYYSAGVFRTPTRATCSQKLVTMRMRHRAYDFVGPQYVGPHPFP